MLIKGTIISNKDFFFEAKKLNFSIASFEDKLFYVCSENNPPLNSNINIIPIGAGFIEDQKSPETIFIGSSPAMYNNMEEVTTFTREALRLIKKQGTLIGICEQAEAEKLLLNYNELAIFK